MVESILKSSNSICINSDLLAKAVIKLLKKDISERYKQTGEVTDEDWEFCEQIDWHPVDELQPTEESINLLEEAKEGPFIKLNSISEIFSK